MAKSGFDPVSDHRPRITVIGVGGAGGNAVNNMIRSNLEGVDFVICNTDSQALTGSDCERRIQLGVNITQGLGAGARADIGRAAAEEAIDEIVQAIQGSNMVFVTAGLGGGTGSGAAPVIARIAREQGVLTVGVVTKPFQFEGRHRMRSAEQALEELQNHVDTLIVTPNQNLFRLANEHTTFADAFKMADDVLYCGVRGVTDLMVNPGVVNLDFADIRTTMSEMGKAMMGTGESDGDHRAVEAAEAAIANPLLEGVTMRGAKAVLINITGGMDMTLFEVDEAAQRVCEEVDSDANIIWGSAIDNSLEGRIRVSVVATGIETDAQEADIPRRTQPARAPRSATLRSENAADRPAPAAAPAPVVAPPRRPAEVAAERPANTSAELAAAINERKAQEAERRRRAEAEAESQRRRPSVINAPRRAAEVERGDARRITPEAPAYERRRAAAADVEEPAAEEAFIAPPPARAEPAADIVEEPAPPAPAARAESGGARAPNLFERVTGATQPAREPAPRAGRSESEELLDIPAFLRRQSN